jgi:uncharacterized protein with HEPN domain
MPHDRRAYLWDIIEAAKAIESFVVGRSPEQYSTDRMLRSAVERQFEIIGEALSQATRRFPDLTGRISHTAAIIAFRNRLIHGYHLIDNEAVWASIGRDLPLLRREAEQLLREAEEQSR